MSSTPGIENGPVYYRRPWTLISRQDTFISHVFQSNPSLKTGNAVFLEVSSALVGEQVYINYKHCAALWYLDFLKIDLMCQSLLSYQLYHHVSSSLAFSTSPFIARSLFSVRFILSLTHVLYLSLCLGLSRFG